jgi:manganese/iron transport system ATP-binding protein
MPEPIRHDIPHQPGAPILEAREVSVRYDGRPALADITFALSAGDRVAVVGPNGAGKSTLFKVIAGVLRPTGGSVRIGGHGPTGHICIAYLPQRTEVDWRFPVTVRDVVMMGRVGQLGWLRRPGRRDRERVLTCLERVGLGDLAGRPIGRLSGGQQQRMFIARALAQEAEIMLMDEPLTGVDVGSQQEIFTILDDLRKQGVTVLVATHDLDLAAERCDRILLLNRRLIGFGRATEVFTAEQLKAAYGGHVRLVPTADGVMVLTDTCCDHGHPHD